MGRTKRIVEGGESPRGPCTLHEKSSVGPPRSDFFPEQAGPPIVRTTISLESPAARWYLPTVASFPNSSVPFPSAKSLTDLLRSASGRNAAASALSASINPVVQLAAMPILFKGLGPEVFGVWILINSVISAGGIATMGMGEAATRFIAIRRADGDQSGIIQIARCVIFFTLALSAVAAAALWIASPTLVTTVFGIDAAHATASITAFRIAACGLVIRLLYGMLEACLRGFERYDIDAVWSTVHTVGATLAAVALVHLGHGIESILLASVLMLFVTSTRLAFALHRLTATWRYLVPGFSPTTLRELASFGLFTWMQTINGFLFQQSDRLLIGALIGPSAVGYYSVSLQLVQTVQVILARASGFVFPMASRIYTRSGGGENLWPLCQRALMLTTVVGCSFFAGFIAFADPILSIWMGTDFARQAAGVLAALAVAGAFNAISIVPSILLNATGGERLNAGFGLASVAAFLAAALLLIPMAGPVGAAWARLASAGVSVVARSVLFRRLFAAPGWRCSLLTLLPVIAALAPVAGLPFLHTASMASTFALSLSILGIAIGACYLTSRLTYDTLIPSMFPKNHGGLDPVKN